MAVRPIVRYGAAVLHTPAQPVGVVDDDVRALLKDMVETMYAASGIGLAAPQIAVPLRAIVIDLSLGKDPGQLIQLVNPRLVSQEGAQREEEGCLSIPGVGGVPQRPARVTIRGTTPDGVERTLDAADLLARAFCHEIDHVDGLVFVDRLSPLKRDLLKRKLRKKARAGDWD
jgi:peptide deformylase